MRKAIIINDLHIPFQDNRAVELAIDFIKVFKPDELYLNGDIVDMWEISRFLKDPRNGKALVDEFEEARDVISDIVRAAPKKADKVWIFGNHEYRFDKFIIKNAEALIGLRGMSVEEQLEADRLGLRVVKNNGQENYVDFGNILIGHFNAVYRYSGYTAKNVLDKYGKSLIQGHTHRGGSHFRSRMDETLVAYENFCLCGLKPDYVISPDWEHGISVLYRDKNWFQVDQIPFRDYQFMYDGKLWVSV